MGPLCRATLPPFHHNHRGTYAREHIGHLALREAQVVVRGHSVRMNKLQCARPSKRSKSSARTREVSTQTRARRRLRMVRPPAGVSTSPALLCSALCRQKTVATRKQPLRNTSKDICTSERMSADRRHRSCTANELKRRTGTDLEYATGTNWEGDIMDTRKENRRGFLGHFAACSPRRPGGHPLLTSSARHSGWLGVGGYQVLQV